MIYLFVLGRILLGGYFIMSGFNHFKNLGMLTGYAQSKGVPMPKAAVMSPSPRKSSPMDSSHKAIKCFVLVVEIRP